MSGSELPHVLAIAGPSGSGKSSLAGLLAERLPGGGVVLAVDAYYRDQRGVPESILDVDTPGAIEHTLLIQQLRELATGVAIQQPVYDYATHTRSRETRTLAPARYIIVEGLFGLYWPALRAAIDTAVFLALDHETCLARRIERDARERSRSREDVIAIYERAVRPMYDRHVEPTRAHAALVLDARRPLAELAEAVRSAVTV